VKLLNYTALRLQRLNYGCRTHLEIEELVVVTSAQHDPLGQAVQIELQLAVVHQIGQRGGGVVQVLALRIGDAAAEEPLVAATSLGVLAALQPAGEAQLAGPNAALVDAFRGHAQQGVQNIWRGFGITYGWDTSNQYLILTSLAGDKVTEEQEDHAQPQQQLHLEVLNSGSQFALHFTPSEWAITLLLPMKA